MCYFIHGAHLSLKYFCMLYACHKFCDFIGYDTSVYLTISRYPFPVSHAKHWFALDCTTVYLIVLAFVASKWQKYLYTENSWQVMILEIWTSIDLIMLDSSLENDNSLGLCPQDISSDITGMIKIYIFCKKNTVHCLWGCVSISFETKQMLLI